MRNKIFLIVLLLILPAVGNAQTGITVKGLADCGAWLEARKTNSSAYFETALQGYINGIAMGSGIEIWSSNGSRTNPEQAYLFADNYCRTHPLEDIWQAGWALANEKTNNAITKQLKKINK